MNYEIEKKINELGKSDRALGGDDAALFGRLIHTVKDFYSHSNYVELYIEYYKGTHKGEMPTSVPIYDDGIKDAKFNAILQKSLRTGDFDVIDNEFTNPNGEMAKLPQVIIKRIKIKLIQRLVN